MVSDWHLANFGTMILTGTSNLLDNSIAHHTIINSLRHILLLPYILNLRAKKKVINTV
jgi:hypothetical protein